MYENPDGSILKNNFTPDGKYLDENGIWDGNAPDYWAYNVSKKASRLTGDDFKAYGTDEIFTQFGSNDILTWYDISKYINWVVIKAYNLTDTSTFYTNRGVGIGDSIYKVFGLYGPARIYTLDLSFNKDFSRIKSMQLNGTEYIQNGDYFIGYTYSDPLRFTVANIKFGFDKNFIIKYVIYYYNFEE